MAERFWDEIYQHLTTINFTTSLHSGLADRYVRARVCYHRLGVEVANLEAIMDGPNGGQVYNQKWIALRKTDEHLLKFEEALLISPKSAGGKIINKPQPEKKTKADEFFPK